MDSYIGQIELFPYTFAPLDWMYCNGQTLSIVQYQALFAIIGTQYGGNGTTNFNLPNMQGLEPIPGMHYYICTMGIFPPRQ